MASCKDCTHKGVCDYWLSQQGRHLSCEEGMVCSDFVDKNMIIVLPCGLGEKFFMIVTKAPKRGFPEFSFIKESRLTFYNLERTISEWGKTAFPTREEAEKAMEELAK